jgi:hypothetical protein
MKHLLLCLCAALTVGCSSQPTSPPESNPPESNPPETSFPAEHGSYAGCLAEHGVEQPPALGPAPGPVAPPDGVDDSTWEQAVQDCADFAPGPAGN